MPPPSDLFIFMLGNLVMLSGKAMSHRPFLGILLTTLTTMAACHQKGMLSQLDQADPSGEKVLPLTPTMSTGANYALDDEMLQESSSFYRSLFGNDYETNMDKLANYTSATVDSQRIPYSDSAYPEIESSAEARSSRHPMLEALAKYDAAFNGGQDLAVTWEKANHADGTVSWYGHCNGFSSASSRHQDPRQSVYRPQGCVPGTASCVEFAPRDIRALLAEVYMNANSHFVSGDRCDTPEERLATDPQNRSDPLHMDECDDVNPGAFHVALINWIAMQKQVIVMDLSRDVAVWNYPVYAYSMRYGQNGKRLSRQEAAALVGRRGQSSDYPFNARATAFVTVQTTITYAKQLEYQPTGSAPTQPQQSTYTYLLELDDKSNVLGGEWLGDSRTVHPDFIWMPFEPFDPPGNRRYGNKNVAPAAVIRLWAESMGFNPDSPFTDRNNPNKILSTPANQGGWGNFSDFQVIIDGNGAGVAFLGKKTTLRLLRHEKLQGDVRVAISLDGRPLTNLAGQGTGEMATSFDAPQGFHTLAFTWTKADGTSLGAVGSTRFFARP